MTPPLLCKRHSTFIAKRLAISFGALAVAPFFLAFHGAPTGAQTLVFACSFAPLAAAVVAARTGRLAMAHGVAFLGLIGLSLSLWLALGCGTGCAIAWLVTAQLEATLARDKRITLWAGVLTGAVLLTVLVATLTAGVLSAPTSTIPESFAGLALAYAVIVTSGSWHLGESSAQAPDAEIELWRDAATLLDDLVVTFDASGSAVGIHTDCETKLGATPHDLAGRGLFERVHVADRPMFLKQIGDAAYGDATSASNIRISKESDLANPYVWFELRTRRTGPAEEHGAPKRARNVIAILRDIDAVHAQAIEIAAAHSTIEDVIQARDHLLAKMSHELRTPLNAIIGFSEVLASRTLSPNDAAKQREYAKVIHQSGQHLLAVVNSTLDMSKMRSGTFSLVAEPFAIVPLMDLCCDTIALKAEQGRVEVLRDYADVTDEMIGDKRACKQILINLLSNAVKFTPEHGQVVISARSEDGALLVNVADTGIGIAEADLARLGDPFFQVGAAGRSVEGTGLGLSVVRGLVGLHGGTLKIESQPGHGTRVDLRLPLDCRATIQQTNPLVPLAPQSTEFALGHLDRRMKQSA